MQKRARSKERLFLYGICPNGLVLWYLNCPAVLIVASLSLSLSFFSSLSLTLTRTPLLLHLHYSLSPLRIHLRQKKLIYKCEEREKERERVGPLRRNRGLPERSKVFFFCFFRSFPAHTESKTRSLVVRIPPATKATERLDDSDLLRLVMLYNNFQTDRII